VQFAQKSIICSFCALKGALKNMNIAGIQKLSLLDYPSLTCATIFLSGCNFRCPFCHNAPLLTETENLSYNEVLLFLQSRTKLLDAVCISGGEPTIYPLQELQNFIADCKNLGYKVKLDTNGTNPQKLKNLLPSLDYVAMDIKASAENYPNAVGIKNYDIAPIKESIKLIIENAKDYEFRTTFVNGLHSKNDAIGIAKLIKGAKRYRIQNYKDSGNILNSRGLSPMSEIELNAILEIIKTKIEDTQIK